MSDENATKALDIPGHQDPQILPPMEADQLRQTITDLRLHVDHEAERLRVRTADLLTQVGALREVTKSKTALEGLVLQLREANQNLVIATFGAQDMQAKAESANHRQEEFLSMLAHELRNPLAPVAMAAVLLGRITAAHPQLPKLHGIISRQVSHMSHLVDDLLDASRVSTGKITLRKRPLRLFEIIDSAIETSQPFIDKREQQLSIDLPTDSVVIDGDLVRLAQVFTNLLINATKFTPRGGAISISAQKMADSVIITVKDNGVGIAADIQGFIFELFRQGPHSLDRLQGGLGIGLSLVRTVVEMHGGSATVKSAGADQGSEFIVTLPLSAAFPPDEAGAHALPHDRRRVLLIDDNQDVNESLNDFLTLDGHVVTSAFDGVIGLAMAIEQTYDVIVCDIGLPGIDGYEVAKRLRLDQSKPLPLLIAVSGYNRQESRARATTAGFDHYLVKPVAIETLIELISASPR